MCMFFFFPQYFVSIEKKNESTFIIIAEEMYMYLPKDGLMIGMNRGASSLSEDPRRSHSGIAVLSFSLTSFCL